MKILIDIDSTLIDTGAIILSLWNKLNPTRQLKEEKDLEWDFSNVLNDTDVTLSELFTIFDREDFYDNVIVFDNAIEIINKLSDKHEVVFCSKHNESRKPITKKWINKTFPKCKLIFVNGFVDKKNIKCDVIIDDKVECLNGKAKLSICYGNYKWNQEWDKVRCLNWKQVEQCINFIKE